MRISAFLFAMVLMCSGFAKAPPQNSVLMKEAIKVYLTPKQKGSITIRSTNSEPISFYLFDLDGTMIYQTALEQNATQTVAGLNKGTYVYHAFKNDKSIEGGKIVIK